MDHPGRLGIAETVGFCARGAVFASAASPPPPPHTPIARVRPAALTPPPVPTCNQAHDVCAPPFTVRPGGRQGGEACHCFLFLRVGAAHTMPSPSLSKQEWNAVASIIHVGPGHYVQCADVVSCGIGLYRL
eukprot:gene7463-biopygen7557